MDTALFISTLAPASPLTRVRRHAFQTVPRFPVSPAKSHARFKTPLRSVAQTPKPSSPALEPRTTVMPSDDAPPRQTAYARGETFSRRRIGMYELKREGVDPGVLLKRSFRFELVYGGVVLAFTSIFFFIPVLTHTPVREDVVAGLIALIMGLYAVDTLGANGAVQSTVMASFSDAKRVARHEAAHLLVAYLLGFKVSGARLPTPRNTWLAKRGVAEQPGVAIDRCFAQDDPYRVAAAGLAGLAAELLIYHSAYGAEDDMAQVSRRVRAVVDDNGNKLPDEDVKHVVRWGLLVATRVVKQHCVAFESVVQALLDGKDASECLRLIDETANVEHLVSEAFGS